jgi:hypothetical protein
MWNASCMPAPVKLKGRREARLLALLSLGEPLTAACRAVGVAPMTVRRHARADPALAELVRAAREQRDPDPFAVPLPDCGEIAAQLEAEHPLRWAPPGGGAGDVDDPFDFRDGWAVQDSSSAWLAVTALQGTFGRDYDAVGIG